jgi:hypothetical protein
MLNYPLFMDPFTWAGMGCTYTYIYSNIYGTSTFSPNYLAFALVLSLVFGWGIFTNVWILSQSEKGWKKVCFLLFIETSVAYI